VGRYLVTGCAGFIASHVCEALLAARHEVVGIDSLNDAYDPRLKDWRLAALRRQAAFSFIQGDIAARDLVTSHLPRNDAPFDAVVNLAARAGVRASMDDPWAYYDANVTGTLNLLEYCRAQAIPKFVLASSSSVYGDSRDVPYREDQPAARPVSPYAASKQAGETLAYSYHHLHGIDVSVLRYFTVYGPAGRPDMSVFRFVRSIVEGTPLTLWGDGEQSRDFTFVEDIARGTIAALRPVGYEIFNLGSDRPQSVNDMLATIAHLAGSAPLIERRPAHPADVAQTWANIEKAGRLLDWKPQTSLATGLAACVDWYQQHRAFASQLRLGD
jgi:nucleoside-diphosphate-sugar epimerase